MKRKMMLITMAILWVSLGLRIHGEKVAVLEELARPNQMVISDKYIYITQKTEILIYNLKTFKFVTMFGKAGQGPGEFMPMPIGGSSIPNLIIFPTTKYLFVSALGKILNFSFEGKFLKETVVSFTQITPLTIRPFGNGYVGQKSINDPKESTVELHILDEDLNFKKMIFQRKNQTTKGKLDILGSNIEYQISDNKIFIPQETFSVEIFNKEGNKIHTITRDIASVPITEELKTKLEQSLKSMFGKALWDRIKKKIYLPKEFPPIYQLQVDTSNLYIISWKGDEKQKDVYIYDLDGKFQKQTILPLIMENVMLPPPFAIHDNHLYQVLENEEDETWELYKTKI